MNIALVHYTASPFIGGVERVMEEHAQLFRKNGNRVTVIASRGNCDVLLSESPARDDQFTRLRPVLAAQDIVFMHNVLTMPFRPGLTEALWRAMDELAHVRFIGWVHDVAACNPDYAPVALIFAKAHSRCDYVAVSPLRARQFSEAAGVPVDRCLVIPNGIAPARVLGLTGNVDALVTRRGLLDGRMLLLHPTRLVRRKNVEMSVAIAREFEKRGTPAMVIITAADDPHDADAFARGERLRAECGADHCVILGGDQFPVGDAELAALYRLADGLLFPSWSEGFGLPLIEAALHRLPVFCSDIEPLRALLHEGVVHFPPDADPAHVASRIEETLAASPSFRERRRVLREYGWDAIYERHLAPLLGWR